MTDSPTPQLRLVRLEETLCHEQQRFETLNQVVIDLRAEVDGLQRRLLLLERHLGTLEQRLRGDEENLPYDKPPHY